MTALISCRSLKRAFGVKPLFCELDLHIDSKDRIGLIGANGSGKTTLMKILAGVEESDEGQCIRKRALRVGYVPQDPTFGGALRVHEALSTGLDTNRVDHLADELCINTMLTKLGFFDPGQEIEQLSGGLKKRLAIGRALIADPDLLLMDEPTNHLDLPGIVWLERLLSSSGIAFVVVSHDRIFLDKVADTVMELDPRHPGGLLRVEGGYRAFLQKRSEYLSARAQSEQSLANKVRREIAWLNRGPKARTTKASFRIQAAKESMDELNRMREQDIMESADISLSSTGRKSKRFMELRGVEKSIGEHKVFRGLDMLLQPGVKLGVLGANGSGKTTLLRIVAGEIPPDAGEIKVLDGLSVLHFAQNREDLDPDTSLRRTLAPQGDSVIFRGQPQHVAGWARRFGFDESQLQQPVGRLSGGEKAKVAIAALMLRPADVLLMDEPTNDLDIPTLEVLEESLLDFPGALVLVSHDRMLLDRVCTHILGLDGKGGVEMVADTSQWESVLGTSQSVDTKKSDTKIKTRPRRKKDMSYLEKRELENMEKSILDAEQRLSEAKKLLEDPAIATSADKLKDAHEGYIEAESQVQGLYDRWAELDAKRRDR